MLHYTKNLVVISALAAALAACSNGSQTATTSSTPAGSATNVSATSPGTQTTVSSTSLATLGVKTVNEIQFKSAPGKTPYGFFDTLNGSPARTHKVAKTDSIRLAGWAVLPDKSKTADEVIVTLADNKTLVAIAPINADRPDVEKALKNPAFKKSGWSATVNPANLPVGKVTLKAWAYNSATKEATQLNNTHEVVIGE